MTGGCPASSGSSAVREKVTSSSWTACCSGHEKYCRYSLTGFQFDVEIKIILLPVSRWEANQIRSKHTTGFRMSCFNTPNTTQTHRHTHIMGTSHYAYITAHIGDYDHLRFSVPDHQVDPGSGVRHASSQPDLFFKKSWITYQFCVWNFKLFITRIAGFRFSFGTIFFVTTVRLLEETVEKGAHHQGAVRLVREQSRRLAQHLPHPPQRTAV